MLGGATCRGGWDIYLLLFFIQGSPYSMCSGCGSNAQWQSAYEAMLEPRWLCRIISGQQAVALFELDALQEAKNRGCDIIHQWGLWWFVRLFLWTVTALRLFLVMQPEPGKDRAVCRGNSESDQGHMFKWMKLSHNDKTCIKIKFLTRWYPVWYFY